MSLAAALPAALLALGPVGVATADPAAPTPVSGAALPTAQVNGVVWTQVVSNGVDFVGGSFTESQPAGAAAGVDTTARSNLFAYDVSTGVALPNFSATTNGQVRAIAASADGSRIYIGGDFTVVDGQSRSHIAAIDRSGSLLADFAPAVNTAVYAITVRGDRVWFGGSFTSVAGSARTRVAEVSSTGALQPWAPSVADYTVRALALSPDSSKVLLGGNFTAVDQVAHYGMAAVDATTGALMPWAAGASIFASGPNASIYSLSTRGDAVYATAYDYGGNGNLEGSTSMRWSDGAFIWIEDCHGDTYSSFPFNDALYIAGHPHYCANVGGFGEIYPSAHRALGFSQAATHTLLHNTEETPGTYVDFGGEPAPTLLDWYPDFTVGTFTGMSQAAWSVSGGGSYLVYAGEFTAVGGTRQTGLVRFQGQPEPADPTVAPPATTDPTPTLTPTPVTTTPPAPTVSAPRAPRSVHAVALGPSKVAVKWTAPKGAKGITRYTVQVKRSGKTVETSKLSAAKRLATFTHLKRSTTYAVIVTATSAGGTSPASHAVQVKTPRSGATVSATKHPGTVRMTSAKVRGVHTVRAYWKAASTRGATGVSGYEVRVYLGSKLIKTVAVGRTARTALITGLKAGTSYRFAVRAENFAGWGASSAKKAARTRR